MTKPAEAVAPVRSSTVLVCERSRTRQHNCAKRLDRISQRVHQSPSSDDNLSHDPLLIFRVNFSSRELLVIRRTLCGGTRNDRVTLRPAASLCLIQFTQRNLSRLLHFCSMWRRTELACTSTSPVFSSLGTVPK
jgi:hypothetical protein